jgi:predicted ATPase
MGKSMLAQAFLKETALVQSTVLLPGRCYEQESVPYKAVDSLIDALSRYLQQVPVAEIRELLPEGIGALGRVFPVLSRVIEVNRTSVKAETQDPIELRRRAFRALRELLARLGSRYTLVLYIDDLQWGDLDSALLIGNLLRPPNPPLMLLLCSYRSEHEHTSACLQALRESTE